MLLQKYGIETETRLSDLELELAAFRLNPPPEVGGLGRAEHFWNACAILWGPKSSKPFVRHPWADRMAARAATTQYLGLNGAASAGKTDFAATWAIVNWLCAPKDTLIFCKIGRAHV